MQAVIRNMCLLVAAASCLAPAISQPGVPNPWPYPQKLAMMQRSVLPGVDGRLDHMAFDSASNALYVAAIRNNTLEVLDAASSSMIQSVTDLPEPAGVVFIPASRQLAVACDGSVRVFKADRTGKLTPERTVAFEGACDNIRYDALAKSIYVGHGVSLGSFAIESGEKGQDIKLPSEAEAFQLEPDGPRIFVNVPSKHEVVVVDRVKHAVVAEWPLVARTGDGGTGPIVNIVEGNYPMALDAPNRRLFVVTRVPNRLIILDTATGKQVSHLADVCKDADDCWYDATTRRVFITGGGGTGSISAIAQDSADEYKLEFKVETASGARTSVLVPEQRKLYVAAPRLGDDQAYIFVYLIGPR